MKEKMLAVIEEQYRGSNEELLGFVVSLLDKNIVSLEDVISVIQKVEVDKTTQDKLNKFNKQLVSRVRGSVTLDGLIEYLDNCARGYSEPVVEYREKDGKLKVSNKKYMAISVVENEDTDRNLSDLINQLLRENNYNLEIGIRIEK